MTGAIILFDHLHAQGAFAKKSPINVSPTPSFYIVVDWRHHDLLLYFYSL